MVSGSSAELWFTSEPPVMRVGGRSCWLREQDTSPLPVFHRCVSGRYTGRLLTCVLWTGLWRGSFPVHSLTSSNTHRELGHFYTFPSKLFQSTTPTLIPVSMFSNPLSCLSQLTSTKFHPFPCPHFLPSQIMTMFPTQTPLSTQDWEVYWTSSLTPALLLCLRSKGSMGNKK